MNNCCRRSAKSELGYFSFHEFSKSSRLAAVVSLLIASQRSYSGRSFQFFCGARVDAACPNAARWPPVRTTTAARTSATRGFCDNTPMAATELLLGRGATLGRSRGGSALPPREVLLRHIEVHHERIRRIGASHAVLEADVGAGLHLP